MEKVEEQSLYIIELNDRLQKLESAGVKGMSSPQTEEQTLYILQLQDQINELNERLEVLEANKPNPPK